MNAPPEPALLAARRLDACLALADPAGAALPSAALQAADEAVGLALDLGRPADRGRAAAWRCAHLLRMGRHTEVLHDAPRAMALVAAPELLAERCELMRVLTLSACEVSAFDVALDTAHALAQLTALSGDDGAALSSTFALAATHERMGDSWQASRLLADALQTHGGGAPDLPLLVATNGLCAISIGIMHRLLDIDADAEVQQVLQRARASGEQARAMLARVPNPAYEVAVLGNLGEVLLHQGDLQGAEPLLQRSRSLAVERGLGAHAWRVQATLCDWTLAAGRPAEALALVRSLLAEMGPDAPPQTAVRALHTAYRACRVLGLFEEALAHFERFESIERRRAMAQLRAQSQLFVTRTEAQHAQWQAEQARLDAQHQRQRAAEFAASAERDPLTGLGNRRHLERRAAELLPNVLRERRPLALAHIDIDHFKSINDRHGHAAGDQVLVVMAQLLRENMRAGDVLARHGGEEFVVILPGMGLERAAEVCERLRERVAQHPWAALVSGGFAGPVTISIGLAGAPPDDLAGLLQQADAALYSAKRGGRNRLCLAPPAGAAP